MPLLPSLIGLIVGIVVAAFFAQGLAFYSFWFIVYLLFMLAYGKLFYCNQILIYRYLEIFMFLFAGGVVFEMNNFVDKSLQDFLLTRAKRSIVTQVDEVFYSMQNRYPYKIVLDLTPESAEFKGRYLFLFLRKKFVSIGNRVLIRKAVIQKSFASDFKDGCLGVIFYRPKKTKLSIFYDEDLSLHHKVNIWKRALCQKILSKMSMLTQSLYGLIFLGYKQKEVSVSLRDPFQNWGISHQLARSGLHLTMVAYACFFICMILPISLFWRLFFALVASVIYYFFTYPSISFLRAEVMFVLGILAKIFCRQASQIHFLILTAMFVLLVNPYQLFALDFQLSFALVFSLLIVSGQLFLERSCQ